jgi:hypothetical protein
MTKIVEAVSRIAVEEYLDTKEPMSQMIVSKAS